MNLQFNHNNEVHFIKVLKLDSCNSRVTWFSVSYDDYTKTDILNMLKLGWLHHVAFHSNYYFCCIETPKVVEFIED